MKHDGNGTLRLDWRDWIKIGVLVTGLAVTWGMDRARLANIEKNMLTRDQVEQIVRQQVKEPLEGLRRDVDRHERILEPRVGGESDEALAGQDI